MRVTCSEFRANFGRYLDRTLTEPVIITNFARDQGVLISVEVFHALRTRTSAMTQKALGENIVIPISNFQKRYAHYLAIASNNPIIITTHFREKTVLLSPEAFDVLFKGSILKSLNKSDFLEKVTTSEFQQKVGHHLSRALKSPLIITKHGREKNALLSIDAFHALLCAKPANTDIQLSIAVTITATELELQAGYYQDLSITKPVIVTVKEVEQNALIAAETFKRLIQDGRINLIIHEKARQLPEAELRDKYTYQIALNVMTEGQG